MMSASRDLSRESKGIVRGLIEVHAGTQTVPARPAAMHVQNRAPRYAVVDAGAVGPAIVNGVGSEQVGTDRGREDVVCRGAGHGMGSAVGRDVA